ncbi:hypothetical protein SAMN05428949_4827 [Chitinophaga sp. YR627]|nr:hypothetical protein SAMN05428949_4827 [Chitinophaga sp. YR627]
MRNIPGWSMINLLENAFKYCESLDVNHPIKIHIRMYQRLPVVYLY